MEFVKFNYTQILLRMRQILWKFPHWLRLLTEMDFCP